MADSGITKKALAEALLELAEAEPLSGITIGDICEKCFMNRKSFYYHFKDKYDLINWIFDSDINGLKDETDVWTFLTGALCALEKRRKFYRQAFSQRGQNSFKEHFQNIVLVRILAKIKDDSLKDFSSLFLSDALTGTVGRWLDAEILASPEELSDSIKITVSNIIPN